MTSSSWHSTSAVRPITTGSRPCSLQRHSAAAVLEELGGGDQGRAEELATGLARAVADGKVFPLLCAVGGIL